MEYEKVFNFSITSSEGMENCSNYIYAGEEESHNSSVKMLKKNKILKSHGKYHDDNEIFDILIEELELVNGHILIGFKELHAAVFAVISDDVEWLESVETFSYLDKYYKNKYLSDLYRIHIRYLNDESEDFILTWEKIPRMSLKSYDIFYVWIFSDINFLEIQAIALSSCTEYEIKKKKKFEDRMQFSLISIHQTFIDSF